jgi:hypothetical protein
MRADVGPRRFFSEVGKAVQECRTPMGILFVSTIVSRSIGLEKRIP